MASLAPRRRLRRSASALGGALLAVWAMVGAADARAEEGWEFHVSPYLWVPSVSGSLTTRFPGLDTEDVDADFADLFSSLDGVGGMIAGEIRYGRLGIAVDLLGLGLEADIDTNEVLLSNGEADLDLLQAGVVALWRVHESEHNVVDLGGGARGWDVDTEVSFDTALGRTRSPSWDTSFVDAIAAARWHHRFDEAWGISAYADVGGSDDSFTWQGLATVDYAWRDWLSLRAGWRHQYIEFEDGDRELDLQLSGPIFGATFKW